MNHFKNFCFFPRIVQFRHLNFLKCYFNNLIASVIGFQTSFVLNNIATFVSFNRSNRFDYCFYIQIERSIFFVIDICIIATNNSSNHCNNFLGDRSPSINVICERGWFCNQIEPWIFFIDFCIIATDNPLNRYNILILNHR